MDKYNNNENMISGREQKNVDIYKRQDYSIYDDATVIDTSNEVDITQIKKLLKSREDYKRAKSYRDMLNEKKYEEIPIVEKDEEIIDYDINSILNKVKEESSSEKDEDEIRKLSHTEFDILKNLDIKKQNEKEQLVDLINTITKKEDLDKDLLADLVGENTVVTPPVPDEVIKTDDVKKIDLDDDFYSDSFTFSKKDFVGCLKESNKSGKKGNKAVKIFIFILLVIVLTIGLFILNYFFEFLKFM